MIRIKCKKLLKLFIVLVFILSSCAINVSTGEYKNKYIISAYYKPEEQSIFATQRLIYKNTEDVEIDSIYFHLYPNAFKDKDTAPMIGDIYDNYPKGFNPGQIDIINIRIDKTDVKYAVEGQDKTLLCVKLNKPLKIGEKTEIKMDFQEKLPIARTDFGSFNGISIFENWYPILCVYDSEGWHKEPSCRMGESNFSEVSDYEVEIELPENEIVASTGEIVKEKKIGNGRKLVELEADNVRDFTWVSSSKFKMVEKKHSGVMIRSYFLNDDKVRGIDALNFATRALDFYNETFGKYPYDRFSIVETYLYGGAMEYPLLTTIGEQYYKHPDEKSLESAVVHELAHQWWYVVVGNNEYKEPWLDEALATYTEAMYFEKFYGADAAKQRINPKVGLARFERVPGDNMGKFRNNSEYNLVVYLKGAYILDELRRKIGDTNFLNVMKSYYNNNTFKNASVADFLKELEKICGSEAVEFVKLRLAGA